MGFILIAAVIAALIIYFAWCREEVGLIPIAILVLILGVLLGILAPTNKLTPTEVTKTIELQSLRDNVASEGETKSLFYVRVSGENTFTYYTEVESEYKTANSKAFVSRTISGNNVTIVEEENCENPRLTVYSCKCKRTFWSFALSWQFDDYVFYVPKGTVAHEFNLG